MNEEGCLNLHYIRFSVHIDVNNFVQEKTELGRANWV